MQAITYYCRHICVYAPVLNSMLLLPTYENNNIELSTGAYTQILKKYLRVSSSLIRKIYISENKKDEITGMGNSTATQYNYYYKKQYLFKYIITS